MNPLAVQYVSHMGDDLTVANAARVSFAKRHHEFISGAQMGSDERLIATLAREGHWAPFSHCMVSLHIRAPIFTARQCFKHKVGFTESEVSRRYVDAPPELFMPPLWRGRVPNKKQGSGEPITGQREADDIAQKAYAAALEAYDALLLAGVAPEQARMVLPLSMITEWWWTGSLAAWGRFYGLRADPNAQREVHDLAMLVEDVVAPLFPVAWSALTGRGR